MAHICFFFLSFCLHRPLPRYVYPRVYTIQQAQSCAARFVCGKSIVYNRNTNPIMSKWSLVCARNGQKGVSSLSDYRPVQPYSISFTAFAFCLPLPFGPRALVSVSMHCRMLSFSNRRPFSHSAQIESDKSIRLPRKF